MSCVPVLYTLQTNLIAMFDVASNPRQTPLNTPHLTLLCWLSPRQTADLFAEAGYLVIMPDFYRGTWKVREAAGPRDASQ